MRIPKSITSGLIGEIKQRAQFLWAAKRFHITATVRSKSCYEHKCSSFTVGTMQPEKHQKKLRYLLLVSVVLPRLCSQLCSSGVVPGVACVWSMAAESFPSIQLGYRSGWKSFTKGSMEIFTISRLHVHCKEERRCVNAINSTEFIAFTSAPNDMAKLSLGI